jgi:hypothetical protein
MTVTSTLATLSLVFTFTVNMNHEDLLEEMYQKLHRGTLPNKLTMQTIICITMTY